MKKHIYLVRHGETYLNRYKRMQGWADSPLTEEGKEVAVVAGKKLADVRFSRVFSSDSGRTFETAEILLRENHHDVPVITKSKAFRETFFGSFEGEFAEVTWKKVANDHGYANFIEMVRQAEFEQVANYMKESDPFHDAESYDEYWQRINQGLQEVVSTSDQDKTILIVTHGNTIRNILKRFSKDFNPATDIKNASVSLLEYEDGQFRVIYVNQ